MDYFECPFSIEMKADSEEDGYIAGYGSTFGGRPDLQGDIMVRGCFKDAIEEQKGWPMLFGHSMEKCCGFWTKAREDKNGLYLEGQLTLDSPEGAAAAAICRHGARLDLPFGLSIGYSPRPDGYKVAGDGVRHLTNVQLFEVSRVPCPANVRARVMRVKRHSTIREAEAALRELGLTGDEARQLISICKGEREANLENETLERDAKEAQAGAAAAFMAELRGHSLIQQLKELAIL
jgi:HK97 family phage prohead protease